MPSELLCIFLPAIVLIVASLDEHRRYCLHKRKRLYTTVRQVDTSCQHQPTTYERTLYESHGFITVTLHTHCPDCGQEWVEEATGSAERFYGLPE